MRQILFLACLAALTVGLGGCGIFSRFLPGDDQAAIEETPQTDDPSASEQTPIPGQEFAEPVVEDEAQPVGNVPPDLIASTNPNERAAGVRRDRSDPFALLPTTPTVEIPVDAQSQPDARQPGSQPGGTPGALAPVPELVPRNRTPTPPPPPQPNLARAVEVSGVVQIGSVPYAILNAPNEPHSRYVRAGQSLSNGQVLVKRIEVVPGLEPIVTLEENGIEVTRQVGATVVAETPSDNGSNESSL